MRNSGIGGQAVIEGIMMRNKEKYSVGIRRPDGEIEVTVYDYRSVIGDSPLLKVPFLRGVFNFIDSLVVGMKTLTYSASFYEEEDEKPLTEKQEKLMLGGTVAVSILLAVVVFMLLPFFIASFLRKVIASEFVIAVAEGLLRIAIFLIYILAISRMEDIQRVFKYHGAEHKCINCVEHGLPLTVENVRNSTRLHKRCGTSFLLFVMVISVIMFMFIRVHSPLLRLLVRLVLIPVIAGISYEAIRLAGTVENPLTDLMSKPGLALQKITTAEPDDDMIEVAIKAVEEVFDWKKFLEDSNEESGTGERGPESSCCLRD